MASFNWTPGIGDPTFVGWLTVALYLATSISCWKLRHKIELDGGRRSNEYIAWRFIAILFLALGINKQLDLQTALTEAGRVIAHLQGWYEQRRSVQLDFICLVAATCVTAEITMPIWMRRAPIPIWLALMGASFYQFYRVSCKSILGLRWNWVIEISVISFVLVAIQWRQISLSKSTSALHVHR